MKTLKTNKGSELPLTNLKGKDYLMVAYRLQWLTEDVDKYTIDTEFLLINDDQTIARATITLFDKDGTIKRQAKATKRETKKDFPDHTEKAETAAIGRALAMLGFGTQQAVADLDEGQRLADSPLQSPKPTVEQKVEATVQQATQLVNPQVEQPKEQKKVSTFRKPKEPVQETKTEDAGGWE